MPRKFQFAGPDLPFKMCRETQTYFIDQKFFLLILKLINNYIKCPAVRGEIWIVRTNDLEVFRGTSSVWGKEKVRLV